MSLGPSGSGLSGSTAGGTGAEKDGPSPGRDSNVAAAGVRRESREPPLRERAIRASGWAVVESVAKALLRLASSLILTRLVPRDAFGIMSIVAALLHGLEMFSDTGVRGSVLYHKRGTDPVFLNTAWTVQVVRGVLLWVAACALAVPFALLYGEPILAWILPVVGVSRVLGGFTSTSLLTLNRRLRMGQVALRTICSTLAGLAVMVVWALVSPTVWVLVGGALAAAAMDLILSHTLLDGARNRFAWEPEARRDLFRFGKWVFFSTMLTFLAGRGDRLLMGWVMSMDELALYTVATIISTSMQQFIANYTGRVLNSLCARLAERGTANLRRNMRRIRAAILALTLPPLCVLVIGGQWIIDALWPSNFSGAGWMLVILAAGGIGGLINDTMVPVLLSVGDSRRHLVYTAARFASVSGGIMVGAWFGGVPGVIAGIAASSLACYPVVVWAVRRYGVWTPGLDFAALGACNALLWTAFYVI